MASISTDPNGSRRIQFVRGDGKRTSLILGKVPLQHVRKVKHHVEALVAAKRAAVAYDSDTATWVRKLDDDLHKKLVAVGLIEPRVRQRAAPQLPKLGDFLDSYIEKRSDVADSTAKGYNNTERNLRAYFGADKPLADITPGDTDDWRRWLKKPKGQGGRGLSENTARRRCGIARQFFRSAVRHRLLAENPFADMKRVSVQENRERDYFISREEAQAVLDACPDAQWRLIFALARYGGLRCPSEHVGLRWGDIHWDRNRFTVHSPKTAHHEGKAERVVPIFPELRPYLEQAFDEAPEGTEWVITHARSADANLGTELKRIIRRAGLVPWPKVFQNLRASRETELMKETNGQLHKVTRWLGNSPDVALKHYLQVTDDDYTEAARPKVQNQVQQVTAMDGNDLQGEGAQPQDTQDFPSVAPHSNVVHGRTCFRQDSNK
jgi:integrase